MTHNSGVWAKYGLALRLYKAHFGRIATVVLAIFGPVNFLNGYLE